MSACPQEGVGPHMELIGHAHAAEASILLHSANLPPLPLELPPLATLQPAKTHQVCGKCTWQSLDIVVIDLHRTLRSVAEINYQSLRTYGFTLLHSSLYHSDLDLNFTPK